MTRESAPRSSRPTGTSASAWTPRVYFWEGGWLGVGRGNVSVPVHDHHAVQISIGLDGPLAFRTEKGAWVEVAAAVVLPNVPHAFEPRGALGALLFVDPEGREGRWLRESLREPLTVVAPETLAGHREALAALSGTRPGALEVARLITGVVAALCTGPPPLRRLDPRIAAVLAAVRARDDARIPLDEVAAEVCLSPSRLAHLFSEEVGLPFRRYLLWRKLTRALVAFARGANLSAAAHASGFADSAHLTRTWRQMFGMSPSAMLGSAEFHEIPAPFELASPAT